MKTFVFTTKPVASRGGVCLAEPISPRDIAKLAVRVAGGGMTPRQTANAMVLREKMEHGEWSGHGIATAAVRPPAPGELVPGVHTGGCPVIA